MGKYYVGNQDDEIDEVVIVDSDGEEYTIKETDFNPSALSFTREDSDEVLLLKKDIDKFIALFQAAKDKLCN